MKRVLLVQYHFLPLNHAGTGHLLGHARNLAAFGWEPMVLTGYWPELGPTEQSFGMTWEPDTEKVLPRMPPILRVPLPPARTGRLPDALKRWNMPELAHMAAGTYPDSFGPWIRPAVKAAARQHRQTPFDAVISYCPPDTNVAVGGGIARRLGIPMVVCFGDLYGFWGVQGLEVLSQAMNDAKSAASKGTVALRASLATSAELLATTGRRRRWMGTARRATAVSPFMAAHLEKSFGIPTDVMVIGYDEDAFPQTPPARGERLVISHVGSIYPSNYYDGAQRLDLLLDGIDLFLAAHPEAAGRVVFRFVGSRHDGHINGMLEGRPCARVCETVLKVDSRRALSLVRESDALLAFTLNWGLGGTLSYPGKIFEALGARRPILVIPSDHEWVQRVLDDTAGGETADNAPAIAGALGRWFTNWRETGEAAPPGRDYVIEQFGQAALSRRLAAILDAAVTARPRRRRMALRPKASPGTLVHIALPAAAIRADQPHDVWKVTITDTRGARRHVAELGRQEIEHVLLEPDLSFVVRCPGPVHGCTWTLEAHVVGHGWLAPISGAIQ